MLPNMHQSIIKHGVYKQLMNLSFFLQVFTAVKAAGHACRHFFTQHVSNTHNIL